MSCYEAARYILQWSCIPRSLGAQSTLETPNLALGSYVLTEVYNRTCCALRDVTSREIRIDSKFA
jgi:hypothetical protein